MIESTVDVAKMFLAIQTYKTYGYIEKAVPYIVDTSVNYLTCPDWAKVVRHEVDGKTVGVYTGSAEQGFLQLLHDKQLEPGRYVALTPCARCEVPSVDHMLIFLKVELIDTDLQGLSDLQRLDRLDKMILEAMSCFSGILATCGSGCKLESVVADSDEIQFDILLNGIEIGSYGERKDSHGNYYLYGTGIAEPRFTYALSQNSLQPF
jgi:hypothetical protein